MPKGRCSDSFKGVIERPCIRCQHPLTLDGGQLVFCSHCGAPQIFLSEELQEQAAEEMRQYAERASATAAPSMDPESAEGLSSGERRRLRAERRARESRWPLAVEYALLSSGIALGLDVAGVAFAPFLLLAWLWAISAPILTVGFYNTRTRAAQLSPGFAARLGLLTGLLVVASSAIVITLSLLLTRYVLKNGTLDAEIAAAVTQVKANAQSQYGAASAPMLRLLGIPEFRVGFMLWVTAISGAFYLLIAVLTAGLAGVLLGRRRAV